jgi:hypothetical protein
VLFEGRDTAGKGGCISAITETLNPRQVHVVALASRVSASARSGIFSAMSRICPRLVARTLRSQLVQPRRGRKGYGILHRCRIQAFLGRCLCLKKC